METCTASKSTSQCWLYKKKSDTHRKSSFLERGVEVNPSTPVTCRHPFYYNIDKHQALQKRIYWVESTYISSPIQNSTSSIKIKFKSCCNGQYNMEPKKRSRKSGFKNTSKQCSNTNTEGTEVMEPFIDKFSLIKARRHKSEQIYDRKKIFKTKNPFKEKEKLPIPESEESVISEGHVRQEGKDSTAEMDNEHLTINLKRVGININEDRIEDKLLDSSLSHFFKKRPNISLERINRKDLKALSEDGFIKTENCDQTNKENKPDKAEDCQWKTASTKSMMITAEHLSKLKSKLKKVSYKRVKQKNRSSNNKSAEDHVPNEETLFRDEAPNILDDNRIITTLNCPESPQPPILIPELNLCEDDVNSFDGDTPFVYLETKPDVEELKRQIQQFESSENSLNEKSLNEKTDDTVENSMARSDCQHLEVFVCKQSLEDSSRDEIDSIDKLDFMLARQMQNENNHSDEHSEDINSGSESVCMSETNSPSQVQKIPISENQVPTASSTCSTDHCSTTSKETTIDHSISHSLKDRSSPSDSLHTREVIPIETAAEMQTIDTENGLTSMSCETLSINHGDSNDADSSPKNTTEVVDTAPLSTEPNAVFPHRNNVSEFSNSIPSLANGSPAYTEVAGRFVAKEPNEAACVNGYDSDATLVYDEDDDARDVAMCDKLVKHNRRNHRFSMFSQSHSKLKVRDSVEVKSLKKSVFKKVNSRKTCDKPLKAKSVSSEEKTVISDKRLKVKTKCPRHKRHTVNKESNSEDLTLIISSGKKKKKKANKNLNGVIKLHDVFHFEDSNEGEKMDIKKVLPSKNNGKHFLNERPKRNNGMKNKKVPQSRHKAKTRKIRGRMKNKACSVLDSMDEDDLPKILPPKRRRNAKNNAAMKTTAAVVSNDMERLMQEFPRHNWLENKYKSEDSTRVRSDEIKPSQELYEYSLDDEKMESTERTEEEHSAGDVNYSVVNTHGEQPGYNQQNTLTPGAPTVTSDKADSSDDPDRDRLQIVTDLDQDDQQVEVMIPCALPTTVSEDTSLNPEINRDQESNVEIETSEAREEPVPPIVSPVEVTDNTRANSNSLPPVPQLIKVPESSQNALPTHDMVASSNPESCETVTGNQTIGKNMCTPIMACDSATTMSCSSPISTVTVTSNKRCIASARTPEEHQINTKKRRLLSSDESDNRQRLYGEASVSDPVREKSSNTQCPDVDINNLKEIITAKVKSDINNHLQRTLKEFRELDQLVSEKAREAESLRQLREQKLRDLHIIQQNNSEAEIKRILNEKLSSVEKQAELKSDMSSPPPAHQRPKQNIRELLDKMDQSHSQTPIDCSTFSAFSARKTPLHSPNTSVEGKISANSHSHTQVAPGRIDVSVTETGILPAHALPLHEAEQNCAIRASSAPALCNNKNSCNRQVSSSENRQTISNRTHSVSSTLRSVNSVKSSTGSIKQNDAYIDLSHGSKDSEIEIQRELSRALAAKRQKHDPNVKPDTYKNKEGQINRIHHQNGEPCATRQNIQPPNAQSIINAKSKDPRGFAQYSQNPYPQQIVRPVSYSSMVNTPNLPMDRAAAPHQSNSGMMRPHAIRLLGATALGNVHQPIDGRQAYTYASNIPLNTFQNTGSIQHGTPIRPMQGITSPTQPHVRPSMANGVQALENGQLLRHIPITAARTIADPQKASYVQQAAISSMGQPIIRPQGHLRPIVPANSTRSQATDSAIGHSMRRMPNNTTLNVIPSQQQQSNVHTNMNGKCIVCSKFALYLCSNCQQYWYCSPQCQLKHWMTHQHHCKTSSHVS